MIQSDFYKQILLDPLKFNPDELYVVGGYSSSAMLRRHIEGDPESDIKEKSALPENLQLKVLHGMFAQDGMTALEHSEFVKLTESHSNVEVRCTTVRPASHMKIYAWARESQHLIAFSGSANYSQGAFFGRTREILSECDANLALQIAKELWAEATPIAEVTLKFAAKRLERIAQTPSDTLILPLTVNNGLRMPDASGINWHTGPKRTHRKDKDAAYISVSHHSDTPGFFPSRKEVFLAQWDDGTVMPMRTISGKHKGAGIHRYGGITSCDDNQILGRYLRERISAKIGIPMKDIPVELIHLQVYGRTAIQVTRTGDSTYMFDFSPRV
jgi:hypothetical protein